MTAAIAVPSNRILSGDVQNLPLAELIQFFHLQGKDGVLSVTSDSGSPLAALYYEGRAVIHAVCNGREGPEAVYDALCVPSGKFEFLAGPVAPPRRSVTDSVQNLILEGFRRFADPTPLRRLLPPDDQPLFVAPEPPQDDIRLTAKEWSILSLVNGKRTIPQIVDSSCRPDDDVRDVLASLLAAGLILEQRDRGPLERVVPAPNTATGVRFAAPTLLGTLILKKVDGRKSLLELVAELGVAEDRFLDDFRLLVRHGRISFVKGEDEYSRVLATA